jgi:hypothetical protein
VGKRAIADASDDLIPPLTNRKALRVGIEDKPGNIFSRHHRELLAKQRLEVSEDDMRPGVIIIFYGYNLDNPFPQFNGGGFLGLHAWIL